jgi:hypothetical protein
MDNPIFSGMGTDLIGVNPMSRAQEVWNLRQKMYAEAGVISSPSFLRLEKSLDGTTSIVEFDLTNGNGATAKRVTEKRLNIGDTFTVMGAALFLGSSVIQEDESESLPVDLVEQRLYTYPNPTAFASSFGALEAIYNGLHRLTIDSTVFIEAISCRDFYRVGTAQQGYGVGGAGNVQYQNDSWNFQLWGQKEILPTVEVNGQADVKPIIQLGTSVDLSSQSLIDQNNLVLYYVGYLNTGAATVQNRWLESLRTQFMPEDIPALPIFKSIR